MRRRKILSKSLMLGLALSAAGCGKFREVSACRSVAQEINAALDDVEALSKAKPMDELRIAKRYAALAKALQPRGVGETPLAQAVREHISIAQATDAALRSHAEALKTQYGKIAEARRELERLVKREHAAATRLELDCHN